MVVLDSVIVRNTNGTATLGYSTFRAVMKICQVRVKNKAAFFSHLCNTFCLQNISTFIVLQGAVTQSTL